MHALSCTVDIPLPSMPFKRNCCNVKELFTTIKNHLVCTFNYKNCICPWSVVSLNHYPPYQYITRFFPDHQPARGSKRNSIGESRFGRLATSQVFGKLIESSFV